MLIYTRYLYIFEAAGLVLLVALVGAVVLTHRAPRGVRAQNVSNQIKRRPEDAVRNLNPPVGQRSEEHTSELQSLMRLSSAVFCLKKKTTKQGNYTTKLN